MCEGVSVGVGGASVGVCICVGGGCTCAWDFVGVSVRECVGSVGEWKCLYCSCKCTVNTKQN